jgi:site-specific DNA-methyltransferase (adenine-specific)
MNQQSSRWQVVHGDCLTILESDAIRERPRLIFADSPYNQCVDYGDGKKADALSPDDYLEWCALWLGACAKTLAPDGSLWLLISDEWVAEFAVLLKGMFRVRGIQFTNGLTMRSWIKWYERFGVYCTSKFGRCSRHLLHFVKDPVRFVFHAETVRVPSARQEVYNDRRANPDGKVMDDVWSDIPRLAGTHGERIAGFPTQLPVVLLSRIIAVASDPDDLILDPFSGSGTTGAAALALGRRYIGIEKQEKFVDLSRLRLQGVEHELSDRARNPPG